MDRITIYNLLTTLKPSTLRLYLVMYTLSDDTGNVLTTFNDLNYRLGMAKTTTSRSMTELQGLGLLEIKHNKGLASDYKILLPDSFKVDNR